MSLIRRRVEFAAMTLFNMRSISLIWALALFSGCGSEIPADSRTVSAESGAQSSKEPGTVLVAVASNFVPVLKQLQPLFTEDTGHRLSMSVGSTGKLYAQILAGAPYDVLLAADEVRPQRLETEGRGRGRFAYAEGRLVLWLVNGGARFAQRDAQAPLAALRSGNFSRLVMANPKLAPYGVAAEATLRALDLHEQVADKLVFGENLGQAHAMLATGNAELGFTALAFMLATPGDLPVQFWEVPAELHEPIRQEAVILNRATNNPAALAFSAFLQGAQARDVIAAAGYRLPAHSNLN